jgi:putative radical SAM enzyme (TIGR03279 family)
MGISSIAPAKITGVIPDSIAAEIGFEAGDALVSINGERLQDLIDYQFFCADEYLTLEVLDRYGKTHTIEIEKDYDDDLGLEFETALFDGLKQCTNACPFCFIDQQPPGKRDSLYLKDDDYRLSFLYGSYLTLTNILPRDWERIERLRLSPLFVSVHATEPDLRQRLLKNKRAGLIMEQLGWFQARRLQIHAQVVVCPGINDGPALTQTIRDLASFYGEDTPAVISAAIVPVGLTRFRPDLTELDPVTPADAAIVIEQVQSLQQEFRDRWGTNFAWLADEWFLIAGQDLPPASHYEDYPQIGNGVGSIRQFIGEFETLANEILPSALPHPKEFTWIVGNAVEQAFGSLVARLNQVKNLWVTLQALNSGYWGQEITVTGLLTGEDLIQGLRDRDLPGKILLPSLMLKHDATVFLDDKTVAEVALALKKEIIIVHGIEHLLSLLTDGLTDGSS